MVVAFDTSRKKILWLSHLVPYPPKGGVLQRSYNLLRELARHHDVYLIALVQPALIRSSGVDVFGQMKESREVLGAFCRNVEFIEMPHLNKSGWKYREAVRALFSTSSYTVNWLRSNVASDVVSRLASECQFDVVHCDTLSLIPLASDVKAAKLVLNHHNIESHMMLRRAQKEKNLLAKAYFYQEGIKLKRYEKIVCGMADLNLTCSDLDALRLQEIMPGINTLVVENGVDLGYFNLEANAGQENSKSMIFAGGLGWYPNLDAMKHFAEDIWPLILAHESEAVMNLVGRGRDSDLERTADRYPDNFLIHGFVDDVRPYLSSASVYVCPIRDGGGTKLKILDAMAMKRPIVAYPEACEGIEIINGQHAVIVHSPEEMAEAVLRLFKDPSARARLGDEARGLVERKYSFAGIGLKMANTYSCL